MRTTYIKNFFRQISAALLMAVMVFSCSVPAFAAASANESKDTDTLNSLKNNDVIDTSRTASVNIYKYDLTAAERSGVDLDAFGASTGKSSQEVEKALHDYAVKGVEFTYLRTGDVELYTQNGEVKIIYGIPQELAAILELSAADAFASANTEGLHYTSQQVNDALKRLMEADDIAAKASLEEYVKNHKEAAAMALTDENGNTGRSGLELGLYLFVETRVPENITETVNPWFVQLPMTTADGGEWFYDITCYPKNQSGNPTLDKLVRNGEFVNDYEETAYGDTATASEGDVLDYIIVSKLPHITSPATYLTAYTFVDTLSEGLTYGHDVRISIYKSHEDIFEGDAVADWDSTSNAYSEQYTDVRVDTNKTGETQMTVAVTENGLKELNTKYSDYYIAVYYTAVLNSDAAAVLGDDGNPNDVTLTWKRTSRDYYNTLEDEAIVYTYGINLQKNFSDNAGDAQKVQFVLYNKTHGCYVVAAHTDVNEDGKKVYFVTGRTNDESEATVFSPDAEGAFIINGIAGDSYSLTEIATDNGYSLLNDQLIIEIQAADRDIRASVAGWTGLTGYNYGQENGGIDMYIGELKPGSAKVDLVDAALSHYTVKKGRIQAVDSENALVDITVLNSKGFLLPQTGGAGLYAVTILGVFGVVCGCFFLCRKKKSV